MGLPTTSGNNCSDGLGELEGARAAADEGVDLANRTTEVVTFTA